MKKNKLNTQKSAANKPAPDTGLSPDHSGMYQFLVYIIAIVIFAYTCLRASMISICHDEALTYLVHVRGSLQEIFLHLRPFNANNHLLNTLLIKSACYLFGNSEFVIRIPALIGHALYLIGTFKILRLLLNRSQFVIGFLLMSTDPFLLDFFSCARGYSLGLGFMMLGLYFFLKRYYTVSVSRIKYNIFAMVLLSLSAISNLTFLNVYIPITFLLCLSEIYDNRALLVRSAFRGIAAISSRVFIPAALTMVFLRLIYSSAVLRRIVDSVEFSTVQQGFWSGTVSSILECVFRGDGYFNSSIKPLLMTSVMIIYMIAAAIAITNLAKRGASNKTSICLSSLTAILLLMASMMQMQHILFGIKLPMDRAAIFFVPIYFVMFLSIWPCVQSVANNAMRLLIKGAFLSLASIMILHGLLCMNISYFYIWEYDAGTKEAMRIINDAVKNSPFEPGKYRIGINWLFEPATNYYIVKDGMHSIEFTTRNGPDGPYDFYYLLDADKGLVKKYGLKVIKHFKASDAFLAIPAAGNQ